MITLVQGCIGVSSGKFPGASCFECLLDGDLIVTWHDGTQQTLSFTAGDSNYIDCESIEVSSGTFNIGFDVNNAYR